MPTVEQVIREARWEDPSFTETRHTNAVCRARLADYQAELLGKVAEAAPEELTEAYVIELPLDDEDFREGVELLEPDPEDPEEEIPLRYQRILSASLRTREIGRGHNARLIGSGARWGPHTDPPVYIENGRVFLATDRPEDWRAFSELRLYYVPAAPAELELESELLFGPRAKALYVAALALRLAQRSPREVARPVPFFAEFLREREEEFLRDMMGRHVVKDQIREVW